MPYKLICLIFSFLCFSISAQAVELCGKPVQGGILVGKAPGATEVIFNQNHIPVKADGTFLLALGRDEAAHANLIVSNGTDARRYDFEVAPYAWDIQNIKGIPPRKVTPSDSDLRDIEFEQKVVRTAQQTQSNNAYWKEGFIMPIEGRVSGNFGGQRIMNGVKKNPHAGMDIAAKAGSEVKAPAAGIVTLAQPNLFYSGNVLIVDHGYGLHTIYAHLQKMNVKRGDTVKQGDIIGLVGQTGRATGPHLHWGASANGVKFNPPSLLNINKSNDFCFIL